MLITNGHPCRTMLALLVNCYILLILTLRRLSALQLKLLRE